MIPTIRRGPWRAVRRCAVVVFMPTISYPFCDTTSHIVESEGVGREAAGLPGLPEIVGFAAPLAAGHPRFHRVAPPVGCLRSGAGGVFPFGFRKKAVVLSGRLG